MNWIYFLSLLCSGFVFFFFFIRASERSSRWSERSSDRCIDISRHNQERSLLIRILEISIYSVFWSLSLSLSLLSLRADNQRDPISPHLFLLRDPGRFTLNFSAQLLQWIVLYFSHLYSWYIYIFFSLKEEMIWIRTEAFLFEMDHVWGIMKLVDTLSIYFSDSHSLPEQFKRRIKNTERLTGLLPTLRARERWFSGYFQRPLVLPIIDIFHC